MFVWVEGGVSHYLVTKEQALLPHLMVSMIV